MAKQSGQKLKPLLLYKILFERSDEDHPLTVQELIDALAEEDISAERKSIYTDLAALTEFGADIQCRKGKVPGWYIGSRNFELPELKLLVDAVQASKFITTRKSDALIKKLEGLASRYEATQLQRQVYVDRRVKTMNESIYYIVDRLHAAIAEKKAISFRYFDYDMEKKKAFHRAGERYIVSPYGLIWSNENYYLVCWDTENEDVRHFRVDKMSDIVTLCLPCTPVPKDFSLEGYAGRHFSMFTGTPGKVTLRCKRTMAGVVVDRFGRDVMLIPAGPDCFTVTVDVAVSPQFFGWLFGLGNNVTVTAPPWAVEDYKNALKQVTEQYI
ncbi:MAG: WYL domain-containing protein [Oscillospiraceae bacterium]